MQTFPAYIEDDIIFFLQEVMYEIVTKLKDDLIFFIFMDNVSMMDRASWKLFELVNADLDNLLIVMSI